MTTITFQDIDNTQINHVLAYLEKEKLNFEVSKPEINGNSWIHKPLHLWTDEEKLERKKFIEENVYLKAGEYEELVDDPFNLKA
jgi:hypothetical protein